MRQDINVKAAVEAAPNMHTFSDTHGFIPNQVNQLFIPFFFFFYKIISEPGLGPQCNQHCIAHLQVTKNLKAQNHSESFNPQNVITHSEAFLLRAEQFALHTCIYFAQMTYHAEIKTLPVPALLAKSLYLCMEVKAGCRDSAGFR